MMGGDMKMRNINRAGRERRRKRPTGKWKVKIVKLWSLKRGELKANWNRGK
jgi:hypothetical protein